VLLDQILVQEIKDSELSLSRTNEESVYKRDLKKRIELINWVLENMKNPDVEICSLIEYRMNETIQEIKKLDSIFENDILDSELRILDWIFYQVCKDQQKI
jgi:ferritin-like metal-binding protein YciE